MDYKEYFPQPALADYIKCYWTLESDEPHSKERIFPDGSIELIFHHADLFRRYEPNGSFHMQQQSFIHGQLKSYIEIEATGRIGMFSVRFTPAGLQPFIDFHVSELTDRTVSTHEIWPQEGKQLVKAMQDAENTEKRIEAIEQFLLHRMTVTTTDFSTGIYCVKAMLEDETIPINMLAEKLAITRRSLERKFTANVGLSPRFLARIIRFNKTLNLIENRDFSSFTSVAHEGGFYDQAHFIKDFKEFTGLNPKRYFSENLEMVKYFNLD